MEMLQCINLPPHGPTVSFDTRLGRKIPKGRVLDFSERQYRMLCSGAAPSSPDAAGRAQLVVTPNEIRGGYNGDTGVIEVEYNGNLHQANSATRHETGHFLRDYENGQEGHAYYGLTKRLYSLGFWVVSAAALAGAACTDVYVINEIQHTSPPDYFYAISEAVGAVGLCGIFMRLSYRLHPEELRADHVMRKYKYLNPISLRYESDYWHGRATD